MPSEQNSPNRIECSSQPCTRLNPSRVSLPACIGTVMTLPRISLTIRCRVISSISTKGRKTTSPQKKTVNSRR